MGLKKNLAHAEGVRGTGLVELLSILLPENYRHRDGDWIKKRRRMRVDEGKDAKSHHRQWAEFKFSVVGSLFAAPPKDGELADLIRQMAQRVWKHPLTGKNFKLGFSTIESWYYAAKNDKCDPVGRLRTKTRNDAGKSRSLIPEVMQLLKEQYAQYPSWTYQLHADNLRSRVEKDSKLGTTPSYPTVQRYMKANGLKKQRRPRSEADAAAINRLEQREVRSYEVEYVNALWHLDCTTSYLLDRERAYLFNKRMFDRRCPGIFFPIYKSAT